MNGLLLVAIGLTVVILSIGAAVRFFRRYSSTSYHDDGWRRVH